MDSKSNCISKCYKEKTTKLHPLYLIPVKSKTPFCLTNTENLYDKCNLENKKDDNYVEYFTPMIGMSEIYILNNIYNINSWNDLVNYLKKNKKLLQNTIDRLLKFCWISFYKSYKSDIDDIIKVYNTYIDLFYKDSKISISDIIFSIKKNNIKKEDIFLYIERFILANK